MKALILAGGFGTRLSSVVKGIPKPMAPVMGRPFLEYQLNFLKKNGIKDIILAVHYLSSSIKSYFGNGHRFGVDITYSEESIPLGTGGAIKNAERFLEDKFLVLNGDSYSKINLEELIQSHNSKNVVATLALTKLPSEEIVHYGGIVLENNQIKSFSEKSKGTQLANRGIYVMNNQIFEYILPEKKISLEEQIFPCLAEKNLLSGYYIDGPFIDIGRPETFAKFKEFIYNSTIIEKGVTVKDAMSRISENSIDLLLVIDEEKKLTGVLNDNIIRKFLLKGGKLEDRVDDAMVRDPVVANLKEGNEQILKTLDYEVQRYLPIVDENRRIVSIEARSEAVKRENFPILRGKSPLRISFAGGGTDLPYFFEKYGGAVISTTIDKYCHATATKRADSRAIIVGDGKEEILDINKGLRYNGNFDLIKAVINILKPDFGFDLYISNDLPPGRGLASSASLAVLVSSIISSMQGANLDDYKIANIARRAEIEELGIKGGLQDQYATVTGGFNFMEFNKGRSVIYPLRLKSSVIDELNEHLLLCYVGSQHNSGEIHSAQERSFVENEEEKVAKLQEIKRIAVEIKDALLTNNLENVGHLLHESWLIKRSLDNRISSHLIDNLYEVGLKNGAVGGKLLGAGGGGYLLFYHDPIKRNQLYKALRDEGGEPMSFNFDFTGTRIWSLKNKS
ncbi:MAG: sugar phosphate nucleotidyltransferase [Candidatus Pacearchaeota archaeon]